MKIVSKEVDVTYMNANYDKICVSCLYFNWEDFDRFFYDPTHDGLGECMHPDTGFVRVDPFWEACEHWQYWLQEEE